MAKIKGICKNIDGCDLAADKVPQEVDSFDFKCKECGKELSPVEDAKKKKAGTPKFAIIVGIITLLAIIGGIIAFSGGSTEEPQIQAPIDSVAVKDSVEVTPMVVKDTVIVTDTVVQRDTVTIEAPTKATESQPASVNKPAKSASSGSKNLGYATFKGSWPNDVNGRMVFTSSHVIDSKDPKKRVAEAGDYVIGEWADGHLVQGIWYGADNQVKGSIIIGR